MNQTLKSYDIEPEQAKAIKELNKIVGKEIPFLDERGLPAFGFKVKDKHVIGLWLYNCGLEKFPQVIFEFKELKELYLSYNLLNSIPTSI